ncbi:MAG: M50 family metallopeptidase [Ignavibacteria bacterium]|nr:M50 family metallopeptidase [Ignavibacteria bacterium]
MSKFSSKNKTIIEIILLISFGIILYLFWNSWFIYPIKLFTVLVHEICHGIAAVLSGGSISSIEISKLLGGECRTYGGNVFIVASSGYLGSLITGFILFISSYNIKRSIIVCTIISIIIFLFTISFIKGRFGIIFSLISAVILYSSPRYFHSILHYYFIRFIGFASVFYVLIDIKEDILTNEVRITDAHILAQYSGISHLAWGFIWIAVCLILIFLLLKFSIKKGATLK